MADHGPVEAEDQAAAEVQHQEDRHNQQAATSITVTMSPARFQLLKGADTWAMAATVKDL